MNETKPLIEYYKEKLIEIDGSGPVEEVFKNIIEALGETND